MCNDGLQGEEAPLIQPDPGRRTPGRPVIVGEVLFDLFPDGTSILGGAPLNVAWHLQAFALEPLLITRVGEDAEGEAIVDAMIGWGMDLAGLQTDIAAPTGRVRVEIDDGEPFFAILPDQAYDNLDRDEALAAIRAHETSLVYHGSLIARSPASLSTVCAIRELDGLPAFVDVNLRAPWWSSSTMFSLLDGARWVKLNRNEIALLLEVAAVGAEIDICAAVRVLQQRHRLTQVIVTKGGEGASVRDGDVFTEGGPATPQEIVDTVGAGDAFSAVWIAGLISGWSTEQTLARALDFAADVCTYQGAVTDDRSLYLRHLENWQET